MPDAPSPQDVRYPARLLSDLHLGHDVSTIRKTAELQPLLDGIATLILNGDTYEARLPRFRERSAQLLEELVEMASKQGVRLVCLNGNHDPSHWEHDCLDLARGRVFITHGHVLLPMVSPWSAKLKHCRAEMEAISQSYQPGQLREISARFERTRRWSETMLATDVRQAGSGRGAKLAMALREIWPPSRPWNVAKVWTTLPWIASQFAEEFRPHCRVMLFGHTHRAAWWRKKGRLLVNTGGFISFAKPLAIDMPDESLVMVRKIEFQNDEYRPGVVATRQEFEG